MFAPFLNLICLRQKYMFCNEHDGCEIQISSYLYFVPAFYVVVSI